jgi:hypothetical protein
MVSTRIAYLTPLFYDKSVAHEADRQFLLALARGIIQASQGPWQVDVISYGDVAGREALEAGLTLRLLRAARRPILPWDVLSWELPEALADADLVHIHDFATRTGEMGLFVAKLLRKPVCVSDLGNRSSDLGSDLQIADLADRIICFSECGVTVRAVNRETELQAVVARLLGIYQDLLARAQGIAA